MDTNQGERLEAELTLLQAMFPDQILWSERSRQLKYDASERCFELRISSDYLSTQLPDVISASIGRTDVRDQLRQHIQSFNAGEEILDSILLAFNEIPAPTATSEIVSPTDIASKTAFNAVSSKATVIVWLHHLLNTNKRKLALSPSSPNVFGVTKPGYPGVLVYSGPAKDVHEHVNELKQQNWQAFQVRLEDDEEWTFTHGAGVVEVEAMKDVVAEIGEKRKELFMEAMRMK